MGEHIITAKEIRELQAMSNNPVNRELTKIRAQLEDFVKRNKYERCLSVPINLESINDKDLELIEEILEENGLRVHIICEPTKGALERYNYVLKTREVGMFISHHGYGPYYTKGVFFHDFNRLTDKQKEILEPYLVYRIYW